MNAHQRRKTRRQYIGGMIKQAKRWDKTGTDEGWRLAVLNQRDAARSKPSGEYEREIRRRTNNVDRGPETPQKLTGRI